MVGKYVCASCVGERRAVLNGLGGGERGCVRLRWDGRRWDTCLELCNCGDLHITQSRGY